MRKYVVLGLLLVVIASVFFYLRMNKDIDIEYEVVYQVNGLKIDESKKERDYEVIEHENNYYVVIYYGQVETYYSYLEVLDVKIKGKVVTISVDLPKEGHGDVASYPYAIVKLNKKPSKTNIKYN